MLNLKVSKNILLYGVGDFIVTGVSAFLFIPLYLKFLDSQDYGVLNILNNNLTLFTYIFQLGVISAFSRIYFLKKTDGLEKQYIWNIIFWHLYYSAFLFLIYFTFKPFIFDLLSPSINKNSPVLYYPPLMGFITFIPALYYVYLRIEEEVYKFVQYQILTVALVSLFILISYMSYGINLVSILISFLLSNLIIWGIAIFNIKFSVNFKFGSKDIFETLRFALPIFVGYFAYFLISKYNLLILQKYISLGEIGRFSLSMQIAAIPSLISIAIVKAVQPILFSLNSDSELKYKAQIVDKNYKIFMVWMVGCLIFSLDSLFVFILPTSYQSIIETTKYLLLINLVYNFGVIENTILLYKLKGKKILLITLFSSVLNVWLCNILIKTYSVNGVLFSMAVSFAVSFLLELYFSRKFIKLNYDIKIISTSLLLITFNILMHSSNMLFSLPVSQNIFSALCIIALTFIFVLGVKKNIGFLNI
jgi:O-antigen/teichoic acid export membrane protein